MFSFLSRGRLNYIAELKMLLRQLNLPLRMDTTSTHDERQFSIGAANMPVPYHLDESDSDSIVSAIFFFVWMNFACPYFTLLWGAKI